MRETKDYRKMREKQNPQMRDKQNPGKVYGGGKYQDKLVDILDPANINQNIKQLSRNIFNKLEQLKQSLDCQLFCSSCFSRRRRRDAKPKQNPAGTLSSCS